MRDGNRKRATRKGSGFVGRPLELGSLLADLRTAKGLSLREVEEATVVLLRSNPAMPRFMRRVGRPRGRFWWRERFHSLRFHIAEPLDAQLDTSARDTRPEF